MANPYFIPTQSGSSLPQVADFALRLGEYKRRGQESAERQRLAQEDIELRRRGMGLQEQQVGLQKQGLGLQQSQLQFEREKLEKTLGMANSKMKEGDFTKMMGAFNQLDQQTGLNVSKSFEPVTNWIRQATDQGATRINIYTSMQKGMWGKFKPKIIEDLNKEYEKAAAAFDEPKQQQILELINRVSDDNFLSSVFPASAQAAELEKTKQLQEQVKLQTEKLKALSGPAKEMASMDTLLSDYGLKLPETLGGRAQTYRTLKATMGLGEETKPSQFMKEWQEYQTLPKDDPRKKVYENKFFSGGEDKLRNEFIKQAKTFISVNDSYGRIKASSETPSAAGDLALIFNYMKMLDPESVVRESEFAQAASTGAFGERLRAAANKILSGERLSDAIRNDFVDRAAKLMQKQLATHKNLIGEYKRLSEKRGIDPSGVIIDFITNISNLDESNPPPVDRLDPSGKPVEFTNGQIWVLQNGKPKRVK